MQLYSSVLDLLIFFSVFLTSASQRIETIFLPQSVLSQCMSPLERGQCKLGSELVLWDLLLTGGIRSVSSMFCSCVSTDGCTSSPVALSSSWSGLAVWYDEGNWLICSHLSTLFLFQWVFWFFFSFFRLIVDGNMVFHWMKIWRLTH